MKTDGVYQGIVEGDPLVLESAGQLLLVKVVVATVDMITVGDISIPHDVDALIGPEGFFANERFSFETPLRRSALEATIQSVAGVRAVESIRLRARELTEWRQFCEAVFAVGPGQILRVLNDANNPEFGTVVVRKAEPVAMIY